MKAGLSSISDDTASLRTLGVLAAAMFLAFMTVGLPLPVIPLYVGHELQFGNVLVGLSVGIQFLATVLTRGYAGRSADVTGARRVMLRGMAVCACSSFATILSAQLPLPAEGRLLVLIAGRLVLGFGESQLVVGMLGWGIGTVGQARSGRVLAWTGMAMYGSLAVAAPVGSWLYGMGGITLVGIATVLSPMLAALLALPVAGVAPRGGDRPSFWRILGQIWRPGLGVALQGVGFAAIGAFVSLDFASRGWAGASLALTCFGASFVGVRILFGGLPDRIGGNEVAIVSLLIVAVGQTLLFLAPNAVTAFLGAAVTGSGCSMVFPALGVEVVKLVSPQIRSTALGGLAAFQDIAYGVTGPICGIFATALGYASVYAVGAVAACLGLAVMIQGTRTLRP